MLAQEKETLQQVAIKKIRRHFSSYEEGLCLRELQVLTQLQHPNVITLLDVFFNDGRLYLVFEYLEYNLNDYIKFRNLQQDEMSRREYPEYRTTKIRRHINEDEVRLIMFSVLRGIDYVHQQGYVHRDLKPENILCSGALDFDSIKIADFSLATRYNDSSNQSVMQAMTGYVATRWYRAPELLLLQSPVTAALPGGRLDAKGLLEMTKYAPAADMWSVGVIFAELLLGHPLFPGKAEEEQLRLISKLLGTPPCLPEKHRDRNDRMFKTAMNTSQKILKQTNRVSFRNRTQSLIKALLPPTAPCSLRNIFPEAGSEALQLLSDILVYDPAKRPTGSEALNYPFFRECWPTDTSWQNTNNVRIPPQDLYFSLGHTPSLLSQQERHTVQAEWSRYQECEFRSLTEQDMNHPFAHQNEYQGNAITLKTYPNSSPNGRVSFQFSLRP
eukprot:jgi/Galph1/3391/GphlegSOOS_G2058.1